MKIKIEPQRNYQRNPKGTTKKPQRNPRGTPKEPQRNPKGSPKANPKGEGMQSIKCVTANLLLDRHNRWNPKGRKSSPLSRQSNYCQEWERVGARIEPSTILERQQSAVKVCVKLDAVHKKLR